MSNSSLICYTKLSPHCESRTDTIRKITIHHMAGNLSVETCGNVFNGTRKASSNYGIGTDGRIAMYVPENKRAYTSANKENDNQAVTIEVANDGGADWHVSDKALESLINLCVDICKRNNIQSLNYTGDKNGNLTRHNMFMATTCPGPYLQSKFPYIAEEVNKRLNTQNNQDNSESTITDNFEIGDKVLVISGVATADSYGGGSKTAEYDGNINDKSNIKYITDIVDLSRPRPYHLSNGNTFGDGDRGWVSAEQIRKI